MAKKPFDDLLKDLDKVTSSLVLGGPTLVAQQIVKDLQEIGPRWSGRFSNSWQINGPQGQQVKGDGQPGQPRPVVFRQAPFTGRQVTQTAFRTFFSTDKVVFRISNFSSYAGIALDLEEGVFRKLGEPLKTPLKTGTRVGGIRGNVVGNSGEAESTAILDWYKTYLGGGQVDKTIRVTMNGLNIGFR